jgi:hypothetical protein
VLPTGRTLSSNGRWFWNVAGTVFNGGKQRLRCQLLAVVQVSVTAYGGFLFRYCSGPLKHIFTPIWSEPYSQRFVGCGRESFVKNGFEQTATFCLGCGKPRLQSGKKGQQFVYFGDDTALFRKGRQGDRKAAQLC